MLCAPVGVSDKWGEEMRSIDADALIETVKNEKYDCYEEWDAIDRTINLIKHAPTIDAVSVVHGEWIFRREYVEDTPFTGYRCSNCNYWKGMGAWNFCPNCGARMKGTTDGNK